MVIISPKIFSRFSEIECGISTKLGLGRKAPYHFNLSYSVGDNPENVKENRNAFFAFFGADETHTAYQKQVHGNNISIVDAGGFKGESDALLTREAGIALVISTADCPPIFIYDPVQKIIAGIHSGWRSTELMIVSRTIDKMITEFKSNPEDMIAYTGPSICGRCYEVGPEFITKFGNKYLTPYKEKFKLDLPLRNYDLLMEAGLKPANIEAAKECTYELADTLHSYRREGLHSGRALGLIIRKQQS